MAFYFKLTSSIFLLAFLLFPVLASNDPSFDETLKVGWALADITPDRPVLIAGQFHARLSEGVLDPVSATVLAMESGVGNQTKKVVWISCDLVGISDGTRGGANIRDRIREQVIRLEPSLSPGQIIINATHTHAAPLVSSVDKIEEVYGVSLEKIASGGDAMPPAEYIDFAADRIAKATKEAWNSRKKGGVSFGLAHAVVSMNRLQALHTGKSVMYGNTNNPDFSHIEGHEDHSLNLMYFWDENRKLTGLIINVAAPSQVSEHSYQLSGDFWHDTKEELKKRYGMDIHILGQASAAGDLSPHVMIGGKAEERMQRLLGFEEDGTGRGSLGQRKQIALRISDAVTSIYPVMKDNINWNPEFAHRVAELQLSRRLLSIEDVTEAKKEAEEWQKRYQDMLDDLEKNPEKIKEARWYRDITISHSRLRRGLVVKERYELEKTEPKLPIEVHVLRIGEAVFATNPFELYLDYGMQMKARSPATQTFIVQLTGSGSYLPTKRSIAGGAYGAVPASTLIGPEGGRELVDQTLSLIESLW
ncbi:hypothetical protein [Lunatibacter salilacus]|uniref:hypothetical protein n=1 Tax=Lunatibacter salilacus TaxID=2483804 RepID=UPI00131C1945|nr:hypothetical protein [Lunatibacter salilacus]